MRKSEIELKEELLNYTKLNLTTEQVINAATVNGAYAMGLSNQIGSISKDKTANLLITKEIKSIDDLVYYYADNLIDQVIINGEII